jgi:hypothetical protein
MKPPMPAAKAISIENDGSSPRWRRSVAMNRAASTMASAAIRPNE